MGTAGAIEAGQAFVRMYLNEGEFTAQLARLRGRLEGWAATLHHIGEQAYGGELPGPLQRLMEFARSPAGIMTGLVEAAHHTAEANERMGRLAESAGVTVEKFSQLAYAANMFKVSNEALGNALKTLETRFFKVEQGVGRGMKSLKGILEQLNLDPSNIHDSADGLQQIIKAMEKYDAQSRIGIAQRLGITELLPMINAGTAAIQKYTEECKKLGLTVTKEDVEAAENFSRATTRLKAVLDNAVQQIGGALEPILTNLVTTIGRVATVVRDWIKEHRDLINMIFAGVAALLAYRVLCLGVGMAIGVAARAIGLYRGLVRTVTFVQWAWNAAIAASEALLSAPAALTLALVAAIGVLVYAILDALEVTKAFGRYFGELWGDATAAISGIAAAIAKGDISLAWEIVCKTMSVVWEETKALIVDGWLSLKSTVANVLFNLSEAWDGFVAGVRDGFSSMFGWLEKGWIRFKHTFDLENFTNDIADALAPVTALFQGVSTEDIRKQLAADRESRQKNIDAEIAAVDAKTAAAHKDHENFRAGLQSDTERQRQEYMAEIEKAEKTNHAEAERLKGELRALVDKARSTEAGSEKPEGDQRFAGAGAHVKTVGTFSGAVAGMLGGGMNLQQQQLAAAQQANAMLEEIRVHTAKTAEELPKLQGMTIGQ